MAEAKIKEAENKIKKGTNRKAQAAKWPERDQT